MKIIKGGIASDHRGQIRFVNDFDMAQIKRFYVIKNLDTEVVRGWRAHRVEQRWFYVLTGKFAMDVIKIDDWHAPSPDLSVERLIVSSSENSVVHVPIGYGTAFQAIEEGSEMLVFADFDIQHAVNDDYTWPADFFVNRLLIK